MEHILKVSIFGLGYVGTVSADPDFKDVPKRLRENQRLVDFVRISDQRSGNGNHDGICW